MKRFYVFVLLLLCSAIFSCNHHAEMEKAEYGVFLGVNPEEMNILYGYKTIVIDAAYYTKADIQSLCQKGIKVYSYLNIGTIETFREAYVEYQHCILGAYEDWPDEYWVDVSQASWQKHIAESAEELALKGIDGFFLDNTDVYYEYHRSEMFEGLLAIINEIGKYSKDILINGGDVFVTEAVLEAEKPLIPIAGVNQECVFSNIDFENDKLVEQDAETSQYYQSYLEQCAAAKLTVYLTEYIGKDTEILAKTIEACCEKKGYICFLASSKALEEPY